VASARQSLFGLAFFNPTPDTLNHGIVNDGSDHEFLADDPNDQNMPRVPHLTAGPMTPAMAEMIVNARADTARSMALRILDQVSNGLDDEILVSAAGVRAEPLLAIRENPCQLQSG
jgi:hypothetical protein